MSLLPTLTVKPLLYAIGVLTLACAGLGLALWVQGARHDVAIAKLTTERDGFEFASHAWEAKADEAVAANAAFATANDQLRALLAEAQGEIRRIDAATRAALTAARAETDEANRTLNAWTSKYAAQIRTGDCAATLAALETACPLIGRDY